MMHSKTKSIVKPLNIFGSISFSSIIKKIIIISLFIISCGLVFASLSDTASVTEGYFKFEETGTPYDNAVGSHTNIIGYNTPTRTDKFELITVKNGDADITSKYKDNEITAIAK